MRTVAPVMTFLLPYQPTMYPVSCKPMISPMYAPLETEWVNETGCNDTYLHSAKAL